MNNHKQNNKNKKGFTIIEVVLVLAIAGLIFLMVFIALPALQRSQRDTQRKNQANLIRDAYVRQMANNRGRTLASKIDDMVRLGYLDKEQATDPTTGEIYKYHKPVEGGALYSKYNEIPIGSYAYDTGGYCEGNIPKDITGTNNYVNMVIVIPLESGGVVCVSNDMR